MFIRIIDSFLLNVVATLYKEGIMVKNNSIIVKNKDIEVTDFNNEKVMMDLEQGKYFALNDVGGRIWELADENNKVQDIIDILLTEYEIDEETCKNEVIRYIEELLSNGVIKIK